MLAILALIKAWPWDKIIKYGLIVLLVVFALGTAYRHGVSTEGARKGKEISDLKLDWQKEINKAKDAQLQAETRERDKERKWQKDFDEERKNAQLQIAQSQADAATSRAATVRLRDAYAAFAASVSGRAGQASGTPAGGPSTEELVRTGSDVFSEVAEEGRRMAEEATATRIAGNACTRSYDRISAQTVMK